MIEHVFVPAEALTELATLDLSTAVVADVERAVSTLIRTRSWVDAREAQFISALDRLADSGKGAGGRDTVHGSGRTAGRTSAKASARAKTIGDAPDELGDALADGDIGTDHVDAVTRATADLDDDQTQDLLNEPGLTDAAKRMSPDPFNTYVKDLARQRLEAEGEKRLERQKRETRTRKWVRRDGMHILNCEYDPETGATVFAQIDAEVDSMTQRPGVAKNDHTAAHALAGLIDRGAGAGPNRIPAEIIVIDVDTLKDGLHEHSTCETHSGVHLPPETVRRIACDATMAINTLRSGDGTVLNAGRESRTATRAQRRALRSMYKSCAFGDCDRRFDWCQIHHIRPWKAGGPTDLNNLIPLCSRHHHSVHEGGWDIHLDPDRTLHIAEPSGQHHKTVPLPSTVTAAGINKQRLQEHQAIRKRFNELIANIDQTRHRQPTHQSA